MIRKIELYLIGFFLLLTASSVCGQYTGEIIPFPFGRPTTVSSIVHQDKILIPVIYFSEPDNSTIIEVDKNFNLDYHHICKFVFAGFPVAEVNDKLYFYAKDREQRLGLKLGLWNGIDTMSWIRDVNLGGDYNTPGDIKAFDNHILTCSSREFDVEDEDDEIVDVVVAKFDTLAQNIWSLNLSNGDGSSYSYYHDIENSGDTAIYLSVLKWHFPHDKIPELLKISPDGDILWRVGENDGGTYVNTHFVLPLDNGQIVLIYSLDRFFDQEYRNNGWNLAPIRMQWFSSEGERLFHKTFINKEHFNDRTAFSQVKKAKGDYFFATGRFEQLKDGVREYYGVVVKFDYQGDTVWSRRYRLDDYNKSEIWYNINDIHEAENGNLILVGQIREGVDSTRNWLLTTDSDGCILTNDCSDIIITSQDENHEHYLDPILYPNPTRDYLKVNNDLIQINITNLYGASLYSKSNYSKNEEINISMLKKGVYLLHGWSHQNNQYFFKRFIKF